MYFHRPCLLVNKILLIFWLGVLFGVIYGMVLLNQNSIIVYTFIMGIVGIVWLISSGSLCIGRFSSLTDLDQVLMTEKPCLRCSEICLCSILVCPYTGFVCGYYVDTTPDASYTNVKYTIEYKNRNHIIDEYGNKQDSDRLRRNSILFPRTIDEIV